MIFYQIFISFHLVLPFSHLPQRSGKIAKKFQHSTDRFLVRQRDELFVSNISRNLGSFTTSSICLGLRGSSELLNPLWSQVNGRGWSQQSKSWSFLSCDPWRREALPGHCSTSSGLVVERHRLLPLRGQ